MDQAAPPPIQKSARLRISRPRQSPSSHPCASNPGLWPSCPNRNGESLIAVPEGARATLLSGLRARIAALEHRPSSPQNDIAAPTSHVREPTAQFWTFGAPELDRRLAGGLDTSALHEIKPQTCTTGSALGHWAAALGFAVRLAVRRLQALEAGSGTARPQLLWCWPSVLARELGLPYGHGLASMGLAPSACLVVETARASETLWAMEEGLRSASLALVIGIVPEVALTPARRLSLAAVGHSTPCLLLTDPRVPSTGATATRWRIGAQASATHPFDPAAPGAARYAVALERCRQDRLTLQALSLLLEWSDETHRFRVAPAVAHRALAPRYAGRSAR